ncbi:MAG: sulfotransferase [Pseudomonadota bacterium]
MSEPNFFVVGAPKCATSSLYSYLQQHPNVFVPDVKEPHFFSSPEVNETYYDVPRVQELSAYLSLYRDGADMPLRGDFSPSYLFYPVAAERIYNFNPKARIIVMLRDPVKRALSHYLMDVRLNYKKAELLDILRHPKEHVQFFREYVEVSQYATKLKVYLELFGVENVGVFLFEDFKADPHKVMSNILTFLGQDPSFTFDMEEKHNAYHMPKSQWVESFRQSTFWKGVRHRVPASLKNTIKPILDHTEKPDMTREEDLLRQLLRSDVQALESVIGYKIQAWGVSTS